MGSWCSGLSRFPVKEEIAGSSPVDPAMSAIKAFFAFIVSLFVPAQDVPVPTSIPTPVPTEIVITATPTPSNTPVPTKKLVRIIPSPTPFGLNDPVAPEGKCYPKEKPYAEPSRDWLIPPKGPAPLVVNFWPQQAGFPYTYAGTVGYQWDFDGNGTWDTGVVNDPRVPNNFQTLHTYTQNGTYYPKLRARSSKNTWSPTCTYEFPVVVGDRQDFSNSSISVDKLNPSVTISKSGPTTVSGFTVSTKEVGIPISFSGDDVHNYNHSYGITESSGASMNPGMSFEFHFFANSASTPGTYTREVVLRYATDNGTVWHDGPTIRYTITVTN